jgi:Ribonuclease G/E
MSDRRLYLDEAPGERRGVVTLKGRPERLLLERQGEDPGPRCGARLIGRITSIERAMGSAFVDIGPGPDAVMDLRPDMPPLTQGQAVLVEVRAESRAEKGAAVRFAELAEGSPRMLTRAP